MQLNHHLFFSGIGIQIVRKFNRRFKKLVSLNFETFMSQHTRASIVSSIFPTTTASFWWTTNINNSWIFLLGSHSSHEIEAKKLLASTLLDIQTQNSPNCFLILMLLDLSEEFSTFGVPFVWNAFAFDCFSCVGVVIFRACGNLLLFPIASISELNRFLTTDLVLLSKSHLHNLKFMAPVIIKNLSYLFCCRRSVLPKMQSRALKTDKLHFINSCFTETGIFFPFNKISRAKDLYSVNFAGWKFLNFSSCIVHIFNWSLKHVWFWRFPHVKTTFLKLGILISAVYVSMNRFQHQVFDLLWQVFVFDSVPSVGILIVPDS